MLEDLKYFSLNQHGTYFSQENIQLTSTMPFKNHPQFPILVDTFIRKNNHHLILEAHFSNTMYPYFLKAFLAYLQEDHIPKDLRDSECIYLSLENINCLMSCQKTMEESLKHLQDACNKTNKFIFLALSDHHSLSKNSTQQHFMLKELNYLYTHPKCRLIFFSYHSHTHFYQEYTHLFAALRITSPNDTDKMAILKQQSYELEQFHHIIIPDDLLTQAYLLANRYLSVHHGLEKALLLLDSSAARAKSSELTDNNKIKPILTMSTLTHVLSSWINIPATHLLSSKFKLKDFIQNMQEQLVGQDHAINMLANEYQQYQTFTRNKNILGAYLFAGPHHVGKRTCAIAFAQQLHQQTHMLYFAKAHNQLISLRELRLQRHLDHQYVILNDVIREYPYAIIMLEKIEEAPACILKELEELFYTGYLTDADGSYNYFRHAIIILSTTCGSKRLQEVSKTFSSENKSQAIDLIQLVMNDKKQDTSHTLPFSSHELVLEMMPEINMQLPSSLSHLLQIIPFLPLTNLSLEKIMRSKLNSLSSTLHSEYGIEFNYAPEVLKYLTANALKQLEASNHQISINNILKELHLTIEEAIQNQSGNKYRPNQLFLQLNETGTLLRSEWLGGTVKQQ